MNTCKNCKWWGVDRVHVCDAPQTDSFFTRSGDLAGFRIEATADDDTNLQAHLVTGPDFGCVKFHAKEST